jgi:hypothetical protein
MNKMSLISLLLSLIACGVVVVLIVLFLKKLNFFKNIDLKREGALFHLFLSPCHLYFLIQSFDYIKNYIFCGKAGEINGNNEPMFFVFILMISIKGLYDCESHIRKRQSQT